MNQFENNEINTEKSKKEKTYSSGLMKNIILALIVAVMGIVAFSGTTYAWYVDSVRANASRLEAANCHTSVIIDYADSNSGDQSTRSTNEDLAFTMDGTSYSFKKLKAGTKYTVTITANGTATTSYCIFEIEGKSFYTDQIDVNNPAEGRVGQTLTFTFMIDENDTEVKIHPRFGTSASTERQITGVGETGKSYSYFRGNIVSRALEASEIVTAPTEPIASNNTETTES